MPVFTIATITLNNQNGLEKTWESIKSQTYKDYEWLVQDGGSSDNSLKYLSATPANTKSGTDNGIYDAMNMLIERATGDYIIFLNAGDMLAAPQTLAIISETIKKAPDFIYGDALETDNQGKLFTKKARSHTHISCGMFTHHQSMLYKTTAIKDLRYNESYTIAADYDFTARFLQHTQNAQHLPIPICVFEPGGISQQQTKIGRNEQFKIRKELKLCSALSNHIITSLQRINMAFRNIAPNLYWTLKQR